MAPDDSCGRKRPGGEHCGKPVPDARGTYVAVNESAYAAKLCAECENELLLTFLSAAREVEWRERPPTTATGGSVWDTGEIRAGLALAGYGALVRPTGPISKRGLDVWDDLVSKLGPAVLASKVRAGEMFNPEQEALILQRVAQNRAENREAS